jgi:ubiquinone/menaquinone biosynthesis C-methylase UbiE
MQAPSLDLLHQRYQDQARELEAQTLADSLSRIARSVNWENLRSQLAKGTFSQVLDAGGGAGHLSRNLQEAGYQPTLVDLSAQNLALAEEQRQAAGQGEMPLLEGNLEALDLPDHQFDAYLAEGGVISFTPDPVRLLREAARLVKPGGWLWLDYFNCLGYALFYEGLTLKLAHALPHTQVVASPRYQLPIRLFAARQVEQLVEQAGFRVRRRFGSRILTQTLSRAQLQALTQAEELALQEIEFTLSRRADCIGTAFFGQIWAEKVG